MNLTIFCDINLYALFVVSQKGNNFDKTNKLPHNNIGFSAIKNMLVATQPYPVF